MEEKRKEASQPTMLLGAASGEVEPPPGIVPPPAYALVRLLGRGGMGEVWLARDRTLERLLALKFLTNARPADVVRFRREARYAARLDHRSIVRVYELGEVERQPYIAMQFVDGPNLGQASLERGELLRAVSTIARALEHAHAAGIVHRDLKPQNILLDREGNAYLSDFGLARDVKARDASLTDAGVVVGTPSLMPPEQARGESHAIDARSDVYSLGATLYAKLTGRLPFHLPFHGTNVIDLLHAVIHDAPRPPRSIDPTVPPPLEAIVMKCLEKDPRHRYASMADFRAALERFASGGIGTSGPAPPPEPGASARTTSPESHMTGVLEVAREIAGWDANLYRISTNICRTYPQLERIKARLDAILEDRPDFALARFHRGLVHFRRGRLDAALEDMERAIDRTGDMAGAHFELGRLHLAIYSRKHEGAHRHLTRTGVQENLEQARSHIDEAVAAFREAQLLEEDLARWQIDYARAVEKLAHGKNAACVEACDRILARDPDLEEVWKLRGDALRLGEHDLGACLESYDRAVSIRRSFHEAVFAKARALLDDGSFAETHRTIARALEICPELTDALALAARAHLLEAREGGGKASLEAGLARAREAHALDPRSYEAAVTKAELLIERGRAHGDAGDFDGALAALEGARREGECENRLDFLSATAHLERARAALDRGGDARADLDAVIARRGTESARDEHGPWNDLLEAALRERERCPKS